MSEPVHCGWARNQFAADVRYHDEEWGVPVHDDQRHFAFLILEGAQAGLSWATSLMQACGLVNDHTLDCFRHRTLADWAVPQATPALPTRRHLRPCRPRTASPSV